MSKLSGWDKVPSFRGRKFWLHVVAGGCLSSLNPPNWCLSMMLCCPRKKEETWLCFLSLDVTNPWVPFMEVFRCQNLCWAVSWCSLINPSSSTDEISVVSSTANPGKATQGGYRRWDSHVACYPQACPLTELADYNKEAMWPTENSLNILMTLRLCLDCVWLILRVGDVGESATRWTIN